MNWRIFRTIPVLDTRAQFANSTAEGGRLLDLGSSDGETLRHIHELRPDLQLCAVDLAGVPEKYPKGCDFHRLDLQNNVLPWPDGSMDAITCMHLVEHLGTLDNLFREAARLLKLGARLYIETPHPKSLMFSSAKGDFVGKFTLNFFDDLTHTRPVTLGGLAQHSRRVGLKVIKSGISRNWLFAAAYPVLRFCSPSRKRYTAQIHWAGWSSYMIVERAASYVGSDRSGLTDPVARTENWELDHA